MLCYYCMHDKGAAAVCPYCHMNYTRQALPHQLAPGTIIGNRYIIGRLLGEGGFGITYLGLDRTLNAVVAIKEYYPNLWCQRNHAVSRTVSVRIGDSAGYYQQGKIRFLREAQNAAKFIGQKGIVDVRDYFEENNTAYIVMEYLEGMTLHAYLRETGPIDATQAFVMLMPLMETLQEIHRHNIIHRDISPDNIMLQLDGTPKLMDFGASRDYVTDSRSMSVLLKHGYAPEEQYRRHGEQGPQTDVYGVCATLYCCITGKAPVEAPERLLNDTLMMPSQLGFRISPQLERILAYGLAVRQKDRCPDMATLLKLTNEALDAQSSAESGSAYNSNFNTLSPDLPPESLSVTQDPGNHPVDTKLTAEKQPKKNRGWVIAAASVFGVAMIAAVGWLIWRPVSPSSNTVREKDSSAVVETVIQGDQTVNGTTEDDGLLPDPIIKKRQNVTEGIRLMWDPVPGVSKYRVMKQRGAEWESLADTEATTYVDSNVESGCAYTYTLVCLSDDNDAYVSSYNQIGWTVTYYSTPEITDLESIGGGVRITWRSVKGAVNYQVLVLRGTEYVPIGTTADNTFVDNDVENGKTYTYTVRCMSPDGKTNMSAYRHKGWSITYRKTGNSLSGN